MPSVIITIVIIIIIVKLKACGQGFRRAAEHDLWRREFAAVEGIAESGVGQGTPGRARVAGTIIRRTPGQTRYGMVWYQVWCDG